MNVFITGTSRGLGKELAALFLQSGHSVTGISRSPSNALDESGHFVHDVLDLSSEKDLQRYLDDWNRPLPDLIILNAAKIENDWVNGSLDYEKSQAIWKTNLTANIKILSYFLPLFRQRGQGTVCAISSQSALRAIGMGGLAYPGSKAALSQVMESLRLDPLFKDLNFVTIYPATLEEKGNWFRTSFNSAARCILYAIEKKREVVYLPRWKSWILRLSDFLPDSFLRSVLAKRAAL